MRFVMMPRGRHSFHEIEQDGEVFVNSSQVAAIDPINEGACRIYLNTPGASSWLLAISAEAVKALLEAEA